MKSKFLITVLMCSVVCHAQKTKQNSISVSGNVIWTHAKALYFILGNPKYSSSTTRNYGVGIQYNRSIYKNFSAQIGVGYFKQTFNLKRPFQYTDPLGRKPLYYTQCYSYENYHIIAGINYQVGINRNYKGKVGISYNYLRSFRQNYVVNKTYGIQQVNHQSLPLSDMVALNLGFEKYFGQRFSIELDGLVSLYTKWRNDQMFFWYSYSDDSQRAAINKSSIGSAFSINYHF